MEEQACKYSDIIITPDHLEFETEEGSRFNPPAQDLFLKKDGSGLPASWDAEVTTQGPQVWLKLSTMSGSIPKRVRVYCKSKGMPKGEWNGEIKVDSRIEDVKVTPQIIPVKLMVKGEEQPPPPPPEPRYALTMAASPEDGGVAADMTGGTPYLEGAKVSIKAEPSAGWEFVGWGATSGIFEDASSLETIFTMPSRNATVTAIFNAPPSPPPPPPPEKCWLRRLIKRLIEKIFLEK